MATLNPRWLSIEMADADAAINSWPTDLRKSYEAAAENFHRGVAAQSLNSEELHHSKVAAAERRKGDTSDQAD
jgi:hypothetical protein